MECCAIWAATGQGKLAMPQRIVQYECESNIYRPQTFA